MSYHDIPALSASGINKFLLESPAHYWAESPFNPARVKSDPTPAMVFGSVCHKMLLEPDDFEKEFAVAPECDRRTTAGKALWEAFTQAAGGKATVKTEAYQEAMGLMTALASHPSIPQLLGKGTPEKPIEWVDDETGLPCKAKADYHRNGLLLDYKTSTSARADDFRKTIANMGYHRQAAWYLDGFERVTGERPRGFVFIVQDKTFPTAIGIFAIEKEAIEIGHYENLLAMREIKRRLDDNDWRAFDEKIQAIGLPHWYNTTPIDNNKN